MCKPLFKKNVCLRLKFDTNKLLVWKENCLKDIREIKYFAGDYIITSQTKKLGICKSQLNIEDLQLLTDYLRQYEDKWVNPKTYSQSRCLNFWMVLECKIHIKEL